MPTIGVLQTSPLSFEESNPLAAGLLQGQNMASNFLNQQLLRQQIQSARNANIMSGAQAQYAQPTALAELLQKQAQPNLTQSQASEQQALAGLNNIHTQLAQAGLPYASQAALADLQQKQAQATGSNIGNIVAAGKAPSEIAQAKATIYPSDSISGRLQQLKMISQSDPDIGNYLQSMGLSIPAYSDPRVQNASSNGIPFANTDQVASNAAAQAQNLPGTQQMANTNAQRFGNSQMQLPVPTGQAQINPVAGRGLTASGSPMANYMSTGNVYGLQQGAELKSAGEQQGKNFANNWNDVINNSSDASKAAKAADYNLDQFKINYDKSAYTGLLGKIPTAYADAAGQEADKAAAALQLSLGNMVKNNRVTNYEEQRVMASLPTREMKQGAVDDITPFMKAKNEQMADSQKFFNYANKLGLNAQDADNLWTSYMEQRPVYDFNNREKPKYSDDWHTFLTPEAVNSMNQTGDYINIPKFKSVSDFKKWQNNIPDNVSDPINKDIDATASKYGHSRDQVLQEMIRRQGAQ